MEQIGIDKISVGKRIKDIRKKHKITQIEFAKKFNTDNGTISRWEKGMILPNEERYEQIARLGGVTVNWLLYGVDTFMEPIPVYSPFDIMYNDFSTPITSIPYDLLKNLAPDNYIIDNNVYGIINPAIISSYTQLQLDLYMNNYYSLSIEEKKKFKNKHYPRGYLTPLIESFLDFLFRKENQLSANMLLSQQIQFYKKETVNSIKNKLLKDEYGVLAKDYLFVSGNGVFGSWTETHKNKNDEVQIFTYVASNDIDIQKLKKRSDLVEEDYAWEANGDFSISFDDEEFGTFIVKENERIDFLGDFTVYEHEIGNKYTVSSIFPCYLASPKFFSSSLLNDLFRSLSKTRLFPLFLPEIKSRIWENKPEIAWSKNDSHFTRKLSDEEFEKHYAHYTNNVYY